VNLICVLLYLLFAALSVTRAVNVVGQSSGMVTVRFTPSAALAPGAYVDVVFPAGFVVAAASAGTVRKLPALHIAARPAALGTSGCCSSFWLQVGALAATTNFDAGATLSFTGQTVRVTVPVAGATSTADDPVVFAFDGITNPSVPGAVGVFQIRPSVGDKFLTVPPGAAITGSTHFAFIHAQFVLRCSMVS
jgi:hypothetical protein